jgi:hypothetical protein
MNFFNEVDGIQQVGLACAGRAAAYIHACHRTLAAQEHGAACQCIFILRLTHLNAAHICDGILKRHQALLWYEII